MRILVLFSAGLVLVQATLASIPAFAQAANGNTGGISGSMAGSNSMGNNGSLGAGASVGADTSLPGAAPNVTQPGAPNGPVTGSGTTTTATGAMSDTTGAGTTGTGSAKGTGTLIGGANVGSGSSR